jgi:hypothetical protein
MVAQLRFRGYKPFKPVSATGGTIGFVNFGGVTYQTHTFLSIGQSTFTIIDPGTEGEVEYLVVGGGGCGGGGDNENRPGGGGGGAGGLVTSLDRGPLKISAGNYQVVVGRGAPGPSRKGVNGDNSSLGSIVAFGGGAGGNNAEDTSVAGNSGNAGGSGGGGTRQRPPGNGVSGQGHTGTVNPYVYKNITYIGSANPVLIRSDGITTRTGSGQGGGGGGAGGPAIVSGTAATIAGPGRSIAFASNTPTVYASGGVGGTNGASGPAGVNGTGGGGGGARASGSGGTSPTRPGLAGGSGVVIIRYPLNRKPVF